jgi:6,7-dimethyl-8-ribityllumazine synthase
MKDASPLSLPPTVDASWRIGIVASRYHRSVTDALVEGARDVLTTAGIPDPSITVYPAPGSFEIPLIGAAIARAGQADALIGCGVIVEGETHHASLLGQAVARGTMDVQTHFGIPFAFEILYVDRLEQALARARGRENRGAEAARSVLWSLSTLRQITSSSRTP